MTVRAAARRRGSGTARAPAGAARQVPRITRALRNRRGVPIPRTAAPARPVRALLVQAAALAVVGTAVLPGPPAGPGDFGVPPAPAASKLPGDIADGVASSPVTGPAADGSRKRPALPLSPDSGEQCTIPAKPIKGTPWSLQRVLLDELWEQSTGKGVTVAVIDTGVDTRNKQLRGGVDTKHGLDLIDRKSNGTVDPVGHGTRVAGIIAARKAPGTGFVGLAPEATILPIRQNDNQGGGTATKMALAIKHAVDKGAEVINISQDTAQAVGPESSLARAVRYALANDVVVVAAAGNDGTDGRSKLTYPASFPGVLAVGASDRNNERAPFSQPGEFVGIAAPGVDMVSTVPGGGHCTDNGTSFAAPYVSAVAALIRTKHPKWRQHQVVAQIQQTAQRTELGHTRFIGWGVVDPVKALTDDAVPVDEPRPDTITTHGRQRVTPATFSLEETPQERRERIATYVIAGASIVVALIIGGGIVMRDWRRRTRPAD